MLHDDLEPFVFLSTAVISVFECINKNTKDKICPYVLTEGLYHAYIFYTFFSVTGLNSFSAICRINTCIFREQFFTGVPWKTQGEALEVKRIISFGCFQERIPITTIGIRRENVLSIFSVCETHLMNKWVCTREWTCTQQHKHKTQEERLLPPPYTILVAFLPTNNIPAYPQIIIQRKGKQIALHTWYIIFPESTPKNYTSKRFQVLEEISS